MNRLRGNLGGVAAGARRLRGERLGAGAPGGSAARPLPRPPKRGAAGRGRRRGGEARSRTLPSWNARAWPSAGRLLAARSPNLSWRPGLTVLSGTLLFIGLCSPLLEGSRRNPRTGSSAAPRAQGAPVIFWLMGPIWWIGVQEA